MLKYFPSKMNFNTS